VVAYLAWVAETSRLSSSNTGRSSVMLRAIFGLAG
jgi:hypothetical protein